MAAQFRVMGAILIVVGFAAGVLSAALLRRPRSQR